MKKNRKYLSFSKLLSRRILVVNAVTISVLALVLIGFATVGQQKMTNAYFVSGLYAAHESIGKRLGEISDDSLYLHIKELDVGINAFNPLFKNTNEKDDKDVLAYNIVIDSLGNYIYHPDRQRIGQGNFFDEVKRSVQTGKLSSKVLIERIIQAVHDFVGETEQSDDLTMLCLRLK